MTMISGSAQRVVVGRGAVPSSGRSVLAPALVSGGDVLCRDGRYLSEYRQKADARIADARAEAVKARRVVNLLGVSGVGLGVSGAAWLLTQGLAAVPLTAFLVGVGLTGAAVSLFVASAAKVASVTRRAEAQYERDRKACQS